MGFGQHEVVFLELEAKARGYFVSFSTERIDAPYFHAVVQKEGGIVSAVYNNEQQVAVAASECGQDVGVAVG